MSHLDDVDFVFWSPVGGIVGVAVVIAVIVWAVAADQQAASDCEKHGEKYIDSRSGYTLCEQDGGTVVRR